MNDASIDSPSTGAVTTEPPRPTIDEVGVELARHVKALAGPEAEPRDDQLAAVTAVVANRQRTLLVARTGFGKSAVYFSATRMLRDRGWGPTVVVSPLLALMRDQVAAASRLGLNAVTINSANIEAWDELEAQINDDAVDLLLIAPERLANPGFRRRVFDALISRPFALVCDEAHCISDWGHDFRPDYRRLRQLLDQLPPWTPVLATTATANQRVTDDVAAQLGDDTLVLRTSLDRASLRLSVVDLPTDAGRLAWLAEALPDLRGSGIIYCLTVDQAENTAAWLNAVGFDVASYSGAVDPERRLELETKLRNNELKALVATSALGMGFDKGDLAFCVHLGLPPSPVAYYQQIGRAGRALDHAEIIALPRPVEDASVWRWFESVALPSETLCQDLLNQLDSTRPSSIASLETAVNLGRSRLGTLLNILEVDGAVQRSGSGWVRCDSQWQYDHALADSLRELRRSESEQMLAWASLKTCRLRFLRDALDDAAAVDCGRCDRCTPHSFQRDPSPELVGAAAAHLQQGDVVIAPRKQWPSGLDQPKGRIEAARQAAPGRALARVGDGGWHPMVQDLLAQTDAGASMADGQLSEAFVQGCAAVLKRWDWQARPTWICPMPSRRRSTLIDAVASALGQLGSLPVYQALVLDPAADSTSFQHEQANSAHQIAGVWDRLTLAADVATEVISQVPTGPVLVIDDEVASRWTMTVAAWRLAEGDLGPALPFVLRTV